MPLRAQPGWRFSGAPLGRSGSPAPWGRAGRCTLSAGRPVPPNSPGGGRPAEPLSPWARRARVAVNGALLLLVLVVGPCAAWAALVVFTLPQLARFAP
jgi:hypothetical protein